MKISRLSLTKSKTIPKMNDRGAVRYSKVQFTVDANLDELEGDLGTVSTPFEAAKKLSKYIDDCVIEELKLIK